MVFTKRIKRGREQKKTEPINRVMKDSNFD